MTDPLRELEGKRDPWSIRTAAGNDMRCSPDNLTTELR